MSLCWTVTVGPAHLCHLNGFHWVFIRLFVCLPGNRNHNCLGTKQEFYFFFFVHNTVSVDINPTLSFSTWTTDRAAAVSAKKRRSLPLGQLISRFPQRFPRRRLIGSPRWQTPHESPGTVCLGPRGMGFPFPDVSFGRLPWKAAARGARRWPGKDALSRQTETTPLFSSGNPRPLRESPLGRSRRCSWGCGSSLRRPPQLWQGGTAAGPRCAGRRGRAGATAAGSPEGPAAPVPDGAGWRQRDPRPSDQAGTPAADNPCPARAVDSLSFLPAGVRERENSPGRIHGAGGKE